MRLARIQETLSESTENLVYQYMLSCEKSNPLKLTLAAWMIIALGYPVARAQVPDGSDVNRAIPVYFGQTIEDTLDRATRPSQVYAITLARGQELTVVTRPSSPKAYYLHLLAPATPTIDRWNQFSVARDNQCCVASSRTFKYTASSAGVYFIWVNADDSSVKYTLQISAQGTPIAVPNPTTAGCLSGRVDSITYSLQLIAAGLPDEVVIGGTRACNSCQVKPPLYPEISNRLENALRSRINVEACYDAEGKIFQIKLAQ